MQALLYTAVIDIMHNTQYKLICYPIHYTVPLPWGWGSVGVAVMQPTKRWARLIIHSLYMHVVWTNMARMAGGEKAVSDVDISVHKGIQY